MTETSRAAHPCPVCGRPRETDAYRPFCSKRCADVDLQRWLSNGYVVPGDPVEDGRPGLIDDEPDA